MSTLQYNYKIYNDEYFDNLRVGNLTAQTGNFQTLSSVNGNIQNLSVSGLTIGASGATQITSISQLIGATGASGLQGATGPAGGGVSVSDISLFNSGFSFAQVSGGDDIARGVLLNSSFDGTTTSSDFGRLGKGSSTSDLSTTFPTTATTYPLITLNDTSMFFNIAPRDLTITHIEFEVSNPGTIQFTSLTSLTATLTASVAIYTEDLDSTTSPPTYTRALEGSVILLNNQEIITPNIAAGTFRLAGSADGVVTLVAGQTFAVVLRMEVSTPSGTATVRGFLGATVSLIIV